MTTPKPALPEPDGYFYEVDGYFGIHRQFDTAPYNGMRPHRTVGYFTADTTRAAIDAAVAEARAVPADWADQVEQRLLTWRQRMMNRSGDRLALDDFMGQDSIDDLIDFVCAPLAATPSPAEQPKPAVRTHGDGNAR